MKKYLFMLFILLQLPQAAAFVCQNKLTGKEIASNATVTIAIPIDENLQHGDENIFGNVGDYLECKNHFPNIYVDYMDLAAGGVTVGSVISSLDTGIYIKGQRLSSKNTPKTNILTLTDSLYHPVDIQMFFVTPAGLGESLIIEKGQTLMKLNLNKHSTSNGATNVEENFVWIFTAANKSVLSTGTCSINNNEDIYVDFGLVPKNKIATTGLDSITQAVDLKIDCNDSSINNQKIKVTLSADVADFSSDTIATNMNATLGVQMFHNHVLVAPFGSFQSTLNGGMADEQVTFALVKQANLSSSDLADGRFSASASLILSLP
ncbi:fimbrial protein [Utexia brackfieldae]|uniref:fimbrial protein n=1 Tax=Utexia brackfieldae TaxID=3074108 RepID=UPI00370D94B5